MRVDPESVKKTVKLSIFFTLLGSTSIKAARKTLVKLTAEVKYKNPLNVHIVGVRNINTTIEPVFFRISNRNPSIYLFILILS